MSHLPPLNAIRAFMAAATYGSFKKAAEELSITPSAISHQIQNLEDFFGFPLFNRGYQSIQLNAAGKQYFQQLHEPFNQLEKSTRELLPTRHKKTIVLSCGPTFTMHWFLQRFSIFQDLHPDIDITIRCSIGMLNKEHFDYGIRRKHEDFIGFTAIEIMQETCALVCNPSLAHIEMLKKPQDLVNFTTIHTEYRKDLWLSWAKAADLDMHLIKDKLFLDNTFMTIQAVENGLGIAVLPLLLLKQQLLSGQIIVLFKHLIPPSSTYYLVESSNIKHHKKHVFRDWLIESAQESSQELQDILQ